MQGCYVDSKQLSELNSKCDMYIHINLLLTYIYKLSCGVLFQKQGFVDDIYIYDLQNTYLTNDNNEQAKSPNKVIDQYFCY